MIDADSSLLTLQAMIWQEEAHYAVSDFFRELPPPSSTSQPVDANARRQIAQWVVDIMKACHYQKEHAAITMSLLDRYVATSEGQKALLDRSYYQLAALTALYTSVKIHCPQALSPELAARLSQGLFDRNDVESMERKMLAALRWRVNPPIIMDFVHKFLDLLPNDSLDDERRSIVIELTKLQADMSMLDEWFISTKASHIAFGSLLNAFESLFGDSVEYCDDVEEIIRMTSKIETTRLTDVRCHLYEALMGQTVVELPVTQKTAVRTPINKTMRRESYIESPRSVVENDVCCMKE